MHLFSKISNDYNKIGIYLITIKDHKYIGSSICVKRRLIDHRTELMRNDHHNRFISRCFEKYDKEDFYYTLLEECSKEELLEREHFYIKLLKPDLNLILDPTTGNNAITTSKKIYQYTLEGDFVAEYPSAAEATRVIGTQVSCASNPNMKAFKSCQGFQWSYEKVEKLPPYINNSRLAKCRPIHVYSIEGKFECSFLSIAACVRFLYSEEKDKFDCLCATLSSNAGGKTASFRGKRFSYELFEQLDNTLLLKFNKTYPIVQMDLNGNEMKVWESRKEITEKLGLSQPALCNALRTKRDDGNFRECGGWKWKRLGT